MSSTNTYEESLDILGSNGADKDDIYIQTADNRKRVFQRIAFVATAATLLLLCLVLVLVFTLPAAGNVKKASPLSLPGVEWGLGTSAYQVEGAAYEDGREPSVWDTFANTPNKIKDKTSGNITADQYNRFADDVQLLSDLGVKFYRFSLSWSRIIKAPGTSNWTVNDAGVAYYNGLLNALLAKDITPLVTLYHWDLPQRLGGPFWTQASDKVVKQFAIYAETCFSKFGDRVKLWTTFNEPWTFLMFGYGTGTHAPGLVQPETGMWQAGHNVLLAHAEAVNLYRTRFGAQKGRISMALNCDWAEPLTTNAADAQAAQQYLEFRLGWFADPLYTGDYPASLKEVLGPRLPRFTPQQQANLKGSVDFFALNHYTSYWISRPAGPPDNKTIWFHPTTQVRPNGDKIGEDAGSAWLKVVPWGFYKMLRWVHQRYGGPDIWVTENGMSVAGEEGMTTERAVEDKQRVEYFRGYLTNMAKAIQDGVKVETYIAWSLVDNFEWAEGFTERFGVVRVDLYNPSDLTRFVKRSALFLREVFVHRNATAASMA